MAIKGTVVKQLANNPSTPAPKFNFYTYTLHKTYHNNEQEIDFVTYDGSLYVCVDDGIYTTSSKPDENGGFLCIIKKGADGKPGIQGIQGKDGRTPEIKVKFEGKQLVIYDAISGTRLSASADLTGPVWKPVQQGSTLSWKLEEGTPANIDLDSLRPVEDHPILLRLNSDNTKREEEETGPGYYIQWKREGHEEWTNLMSISELMNIALAGVSFWWQDAEDGSTDSEGNPVQKLHFGHKQVVKATYDASKLGNKRIAEVELGDVLFDAGEIPFPNYDDAIAALNAFICDVADDLAVTKALIPKDYVKSVNRNLPNTNGDVQLEIPEPVDAYTKEESDDKYQPKGNYLTEHQHLKTVNGSSLVGSGNVSVGTVKTVQVNNGSIVSPDSNGNVKLTIKTGSPDLSGVVKSITVNGDVKLPDSNGNITISIGNYNLFDLVYRNGHLIKIVNGVETDLGEFGPGSGDSGEGCEHCWTEEEIIALIEDALQDYVTLSYLTSNYYTKTQVDNLIASSGGGTITVTSYRTFTIYKWYPVNSNPATPTLPTSASWNGTSNGLTLNGNTLNWTDHPYNNPGNETRLWMAQITLTSDGTTSSDWVGPFDIYGDGEPGADGAGIEFIYTLCTTIDEYNNLATPVAPSSGQESYPTGWTDRPQGVGEYAKNSGVVTTHTWAADEQSAFFKIEAVSIRTLARGNDSTWSAYSQPVIWSMWGEDGMDGDGVEYVFRQATADDVTTVDSATVLISSATRPDNSWNYDSPVAPWTDEPSGVDETNCYEFVSLRRYHQNAWGNWSEPALWSRFARDGQDGQGTVIHEYQYLNYPVMRVTTWPGTLEKYYAGTTRVGDDNNPTGSQTVGTMYLDVVSYSYVENAGQTDERTVQTYYKCIQDVTYDSNYTKEQHTPNNDSTYWEAFSIANDGAFKNLLVSNSSFIASLASKQIVVIDENNTIQGGITSNLTGNATIPDGNNTHAVGDVRIWAGEISGNGNLATAPFVVDNNGTVVSQGATSCTNDYTMKTVMQSGSFTVSSIRNSDQKEAQIAFGIDCNTGLPYFYLTDLDGNKIWEATNKGFNFSGTIVPQKVTMYPSRDNISILPHTTLKANALYLTSVDQNYSDGFTYNSSDTPIQYFQFKVGGLIGENQKPLVIGIGQALGYLTPYYTESAKLVDFDQLIIPSSLADLTIHPLNIHINNAVYAPNANNDNLFEPIESNLIHDGTYISQEYVSGIIAQCARHDSQASAQGATVTAACRIKVKLYKFVNGKADSTIDGYFYYGGATGADNWKTGDTEYDLTT